MAKERIGIEKDVDVEQETVSREVRKERVDVEDETHLSPAGSASCCGEGRLSGGPRARFTALHWQRFPPPPNPPDQDDLAGA